MHGHGNLGRAAQQHSPAVCVGVQAGCNSERKLYIGYNQRGCRIQLAALFASPPVMNPDIHSYTYS